MEEVEGLWYKVREDGNNVRRGESGRRILESEEEEEGGEV